MSKFCASGHQMEESWEVCPYCQKTGYAVPQAPLPKTRIESDTGGASTAPTVGITRKTVLISDKRKSPVVGWLVAMNGDQKGEDFRVREGQNTLGTSLDAEIVLKDSTVSDKHASIRYKDGKFFLTDLDSTNGTYLNDGKETIAREELKDGDVVRVGEVTLKFKCL
ncbi:MAG: FHA domain-containing protein [Acidobacteriia bacterium]|nr:FHA domain-containing protein [Terriglobia bacterium]